MEGKERESFSLDTSSASSEASSLTEEITQRIRGELGEQWLPVTEALVYVTNKFNLDPNSVEDTDLVILLSKLPFANHPFVTGEDISAFSEDEKDKQLENILELIGQFHDIGDVWDQYGLN